jgi:CelD/BcsL family acetyltransferase involved in cellulose biosynthesis
MLTVEKVSTIGEFARLEPVWNRLLNESVSNHISLTWEWLMTWWEVFHEQRELYLLVVRDRDEVVGLAPLLKRSVSHFGVLAYSRLEFLATGEDEADEICSPDLDFILRRGRETEALDAIFGFLQAHQSEWDEIVLTDLSARSSTLTNLPVLCERNEIHHETLRTQVSIGAALPADWNAYLATLGRDTRWKIRRGRRAIAESNGECRLIRTPDGFMENFEILVRLHQERWTADGKAGAFASEKFTRFHRALAERILPLGWARLYVLLVAGEPIAAVYDFVYNGKAHFYQIGRTEQNRPVQSPGIVAQSYAIEQAITEGLSEYELFKGGPDSYKFHWGNQTREILQLRLTRSNSKEAVYAAANKVADRLREIKRAVMPRQRVSGS